MSNRRKKNNQSVQYSLHAKLMFNVSIVGKKSVGKSSLILRQIKDTFGNLPKNSGGFQFYSKTYKCKSEDVSLQIWDTAGKSEYNSMTRNFLRKASAIILVYDSTEGIEEQMDSLKKQLNQYAHQRVKTCIIRTRIDAKLVTQQERQIIKRLTEQLYPGQIFHSGQVSAKSNQNVHKYFSELTNKLLKCYEESEDFRECVQPAKDSFLLNSVEKSQQDPTIKKKCC